MIVDPSEKADDRPGNVRHIHGQTPVANHRSKLLKIHTVVKKQGLFALTMFFLTQQITDENRKIGIGFEFLMELGDRLVCGKTGLPGNGNERESLADCFNAGHRVVLVLF